MEIMEKRTAEETLEELQKYDKQCDEEIERVKEAFRKRKGLVALDKLAYDVGLSRMTDEQKREQISFLYRQLDKCGQMIAEDDEWGATRRELNREYRRIVKALARLEPDKWSDLPMMRKPSEKYDTLVADFCREHKCRKCGGDMRQSRSGSLRVICTACGAKYQLKTKKR